MSKGKGSTASNVISVFDAYEVDDDLVKDGIRYELEVGGKSAGSVVMRPADADLNPDYRKAVLKMGQAMAAWPAKNKGRDVSNITPEEDRRFLAAVYADSVILSWDILGRDKKPIKSDRATVIATLVKMPKMFAVLQSRAKNWGSYRKQYEAEAVKP